MQELDAAVGGDEARLARGRRWAMRRRGGLGEGGGAVQVPLRRVVPRWEEAEVEEGVSVEVGEDERDDIEG